MLFSCCLILYIFGILSCFDLHSLIGRRRNATSIRRRVSTGDRWSLLAARIGTAVGRFGDNFLSWLAAGTYTGGLGQLLDDRRYFLVTAGLGAVALFNFSHQPILSSRGFFGLTGAAFIGTPVVFSSFLGKFTIAAAFADTTLFSGLNLGCSLLGTTSTRTAVLVFVFDRLRFRTVGFAVIHRTA